MYAVIDTQYNGANMFKRDGAVWTLEAEFPLAKLPPTVQPMMRLVPISQQEIPGSEAVFSCTMKYVNNSGGSFSIKEINYLPNDTGDGCHAKYDYAGTIFIPNVDVTTVIALPWGNITDGPVETYAITLEQLMINTSYYHLTNAVLK